MVCVYIICVYAFQSDHLLLVLLLGDFVSPIGVSDWVDRYIILNIVRERRTVFVWCPCMAINVVSVQYNGGLLPDIIF